MKRKTQLFVQVSLFMLVFTCGVCQSSDMQQAVEVESTTEGSQEMTKGEQSTQPAEITMEEQIHAAIADLAIRVGVAADDIIVREARSVQWSSGAVGCPKPGMNYTQALVPGMRLLLEVNGTVYYYHGRKGRNLFYCPAGRAQAPAYGPGMDVM